jgi:two-component system phosphate regulon sensor histidine kinase PhoR
LNSIRRLSSYLYASLISLFAGGLVFALWYAGLLPSSIQLDLLTPSSQLAIVDFDHDFAAAVIVAFSVSAGVTTNRFGLHRCWPYLFALVSLMILLGGIALTLGGFETASIPVAISVVFATSLVQIGRLWQLDRLLTKSLLKSHHGSELVKPDEAKARLASGLKLLKAVLPINEAVVFQCDETDELQAVARTKNNTGSLNDLNRNSVWREGVQLSERAVALKKLIIQASESGDTAIVAVPLEHEENIVGVLMVRLNAAFCEDDRPLLEAVGAQFARNLARDSFSKNSFKDFALGYFSTAGGEKKLDALQVLRALSTEQRCEANALTQLNNGVAIAYLDGTIASANSTILSLAELTSEQAANIDVFGLLDKFRTDVFDEPSIAVRRVLQTGVDYEGELNFDLRDQILGLRISLLRENQNTSTEPVGIAIFISDLTKIKEYEKLKSDMISLMSHELRTPLTSINGFAELLTADDTIPEQAKEFVTIIANESQRMSRMINTFLAVTQLQRKDKQEVLKIPLRLDEVVRDTIATLTPVAKKKRIRLVEQPALRVPPVAADKGLITQVVKNLLNNAIKYSPERTVVTVTTSLEAESVRVSVEDRGFGIPMESKDRVWEKFYRVTREGQEKDEESTGLGLAFVREVVEQHGGSVTLDTQEGRGSKFSFTLPRL